jgi:hypothetical protein
MIIFLGWFGTESAGENRGSSGAFETVPQISAWTSFAELSV